MKILVNKMNIAELNTIYLHDTYLDTFIWDYTCKSASFRIHKKHWNYSDNCGELVLYGKLELKGILYAQITALELWNSKQEDEFRIHYFSVDKSYSISDIWMQSVKRTNSSLENCFEHYDDLCFPVTLGLVSGDQLSFIVKSVVWEME